ncbi:MAG: M56 family metallopeptidase [Bacteroidota bacterium]
MIQHLLPEALIQALGWTMIHSLWQGFAVAILMGLAMIILQKKSAKVRYEIAWFSLFLIFVLSLSTFIYLYDAAAEGEALGDTITTIIAEGGFVVEPTNVVQPFFHEVILYFNEHLPLMVTLWLVGMIFFLLRLLGGLAYIERLKNQRQHPLPEKWQRTFENLLAKFPMKKAVRVAESSLAKVPMVIGYAKPIILFPLGTVNQLTHQEVEAVLAHELAHIFRNDYLLNIIQSLIETIFYYHPAVWWISANIRTERENCCDDIAIQLCGNSLTYVKALVSLEEIQPAPALAMSFSSGKKNQLLNRVKRILNQPQNKFNIMEKFTATCFLLVALLLFSVSATQPETSPTNPEILEEVPASTVEPEAQIVEGVLVEQIPQVATDTIPKTDGNFYYSKNGERVAVEYEDGKIKELKINGEDIPENEFAEYEEYVEELLDGVTPPPAPPAPSSMGIGVIGESSSMISTTTDEDGNTVYIIQSSEDGERSTVTMRGGEIKINDEIVAIGETPIIIHNGNRIGFTGDNVEVDIPNIAITSDAFAYGIGDTDIDFIEMPEMTEIIEIAELPEMPELNFVLPDTDFGYNFNFDFDTIPGGVIWIDGNDTRWENLSEEEREEHRAKLEEAREQMKEAQAELREEMARVREINREAYEQQMEEAQERLAEAREQMKEARAEQREKMKEQQRELRERLKEVREQREEQMQEAREQYQEALAEIRAARSAERNQWLKTIETQLQQDGHIKSDGAYKFSLSDSKLKINGKKQSEADRKKYQELYESTTGKNLGDDFRIDLSFDGKKNRSTSISISDNNSAN